VARTPGPAPGSARVGSPRWAWPGAARTRAAARHLGADLVDGAGAEEDAHLGGEQVEDPVVAHRGRRQRRGRRASRGPPSSRRLRPSRPPVRRAGRHRRTRSRCCRGTSRLTTNARSSAWPRRRVWSGRSLTSTAADHEAGQLTAGGRARRSPRRPARPARAGDRRPRAPARSERACGSRAGRPPGSRSGRQPASSAPRSPARRGIHAMRAPLVLASMAAADRAPGTVCPTAPRRGRSCPRRSRTRDPRARPAARVARAGPRSRCPAPPGSARRRPSSGPARRTARSP
jgi:hypothetical protein